MCYIKLWSQGPYIVIVARRWGSETYPAILTAFENIHQHSFYGDWILVPRWNGIFHPAKCRQTNERECPLSLSLINGDRSVQLFGFWASTSSIAFFLNKTHLGSFRSPRRIRRQRHFARFAPVPNRWRVWFCRCHVHVSLRNRSGRGILSILIVKWKSRVGKKVAPVVDGVLCKSVLHLAWQWALLLKITDGRRTLRVEYSNTVGSK